MDVRGPTNGDVNGQVSHLRNQSIRHEAHSSPESKLAAKPANHGSDVDQLVEKLGTVPEVREELVAQVLAKLQSGELLTRSSAELTARAVMGVEDA